MKKFYLYKIIKSISLAGSYKIEAASDKKSLLFINQMSLVNAVLMLAFSITLLCFGMLNFLYFTLPFLILFALPPLINYYFSLSYSKIYFSILPLLFIVGVCVHNGSVLGDKYLVLTTAIIPLILFKNKKAIYGMFALNVSVFFIIEWYQSNYSPIIQLPDFIADQYYIYGQLTLFTVIFYVVQYFRKDSEEYEQELEEKNKIIKTRNNEIVDSITYAQRLQQAILPQESEIYSNMPDSFILYKPKDIVAGDFYFAHFSPSPSGRDGEGLFFIAAADCTGHGVPGAMVSMVCSNALNRAVEECNLIKPGEILDKVRELVINTFKKSNREVMDGMDISLAVINIKTRELAWAGANNPLWYIPAENMEKTFQPLMSTTPSKFDGIEEIIATKQPIGKIQKQQQRFTTHILNLAKGSLLYLFTDGYADQFGGPKGKKFQYRQLAELLYSIRKLNMRDQKEKLESVFKNWVGDLEQIDDVCIIGLKL